MKNLILIGLVVIFAGCQTGGNWTANELSEWYIGLQESDSHFFSPLYYRGTNEEYHFFICRSMDTWVPVKVVKDQINIADVRPYMEISQTKIFPGYYIVDPKHKFTKVTEINQQR